MLRFEMKNVLKAGLLAAVLAAPMAASAQSPFTIIVQYTQSITPGNALVPIAPPTSNGTYGFCAYIARNSNGGNVDEYISGASIRMYYNSAQASLAAPGGNNNNIQLNAAGVQRANTLPISFGAVTADATNGDGQASTDFYRLASVNFVSGDPSAPLIAAPFELPSDWTYAAPNNVAGTFTPLVTTNITLTGGPFPPNVGITPNPPNGTVSTRRVDTNATGTDTVQTNFNNANITPLAVDLTSLTASVAGDTATISWSTAAEYDNAGFVVYRAEANGDQGEAISTLVAAEGSAASGASYSSIDPAPLAPGESRSYYLADIDLSGATTVHGPVSVTRGAASSVSGWELY